MRKQRTPDHLTAREERFCQYYTAIGTDTASHATKAAEAAGYRTPHNAGWRLLQRPAVRERIHQIHQERMDKHLLTPEHVLMKTEHLRIRAEEKGDLATAARCVELQGKHLAMFSDHVQVDISERVTVLASISVTERPLLEAAISDRLRIMGESQDKPGVKWLQSKVVEPVASQARPPADVSQGELQAAQRQGQDDDNATADVPTIPDYCR